MITPKVKPKITAKCKSICLVLISFAIGLLFSCKREKIPEDPMQMFKKTKLLKANVIGKIETVCPRTKMEIFDSLLIFEDIYKGFSYSIVNLKTAEMVKRFGRIGKGKGEFIFADYTQIHDRSIMVLDIQLAKFFEFNIDSLLADTLGKYLPREVVNFKEKGITGHIYSLVYHKNGYLLQGHLAYDSVYLFLKDNVVTPFGEYHTLPNLSKISGDLKGIANQGRFIYNNGCDYAVSYSLYSPIFEIIDLNPATPVIKKTVVNSPLDFEVLDLGAGMLTAYNNDEKPWGYLGGVATPDRFYLLYSGKRFNPKTTDINVSNNLLEFDRNGRPLVRYELDTEVTGCLAFDQANKRLYGISRGSNPCLVYFVLD